MSKFYLEVNDDDKITINEDKWVKHKSLCLQDPNSTEEKFLEFESHDDALKWMFDNIKNEYVDKFWVRLYSTKPYGQKKYFK